MIRKIVRNIKYFIICGTSYSNLLKISKELDEFETVIFKSQINV